MFFFLTLLGFLKQNYLPPFLKPSHKLDQSSNHKFRRDDEPQVDNEPYIVPPPESFETGSLGLTTDFASQREGKETLFERTTAQLAETQNPTRKPSTAPNPGLEQNFKRGNEKNIHLDIDVEKPKIGRASCRERV